MHPSQDPSLEKAASTPNRYVGRRAPSYPSGSTKQTPT
ncbi:hypothetical protein LINPERPRIM_LOCUS16561 [Linum perenne]